MQTRILKEALFMKKPVSPVVTGLAAGMVLGTTAYLVANHRTHRPGSAAKMIKKNTGKALKNVGTMMETMSYMMK